VPTPQEIAPPQPNPRRAALPARVCASPGDGTESGASKETTADRRVSASGRRLPRNSSILKIYRNGLSTATATGLPLGSN
jgi:hypothetical protein